MTYAHRMTQPPAPRRIAATLFALSLAAGSVFGGAAACAQSASGGPFTATVPTGTVPTTATAAAPATALDPALRRMFMALATSVLTNFAASAAKGSLDGFDPGPALESTLKAALPVTHKLNVLPSSLTAQPTKPANRDEPRRGRQSLREWFPTKPSAARPRFLLPACCPSPSRECRTPGASGPRRPDARSRSADGTRRSVPRAKTCLQRRLPG